MNGNTLGFEPHTAIGTALVLGTGLAHKKYVKDENPYNDLETLANNELKTSGPYGVTRHPQYLSQRLTITGIAMTMPTTETIGAATAFYGLSELLARSEEQTNKNKFGQDYEEYMENTPRWIPSIKETCQRVDAYLRSHHS